MSTSNSYQLLYDPTTSEITYGSILHGNQGFQGYQGFQGSRGFQGPAVAIAGSTTQIQYNNAGVLTGNSNVTYDQSTNVFRFGSGNTGGQLYVVGDFAQGTTSTTLAPFNGGAALAFTGLGRYVGINSNSSNASQIEFHSFDAGNVAYDSRIQSTGGSASTSGQGTLTFTCATTKVSTSNVQLGANNYFPALSENNNYMVQSGSFTIGAVANQTLISGIAFSKAFSGIPMVVVSADSGVPPLTVINTIGISTTGFSVYVGTNTGTGSTNATASGRYIAFGPVTN